MSVTSINHNDIFGNKNSLNSKLTEKNVKEWSKIRVAKTMEKLILKQNLMQNPMIMTKHKMKVKALHKLYMDEIIDIRVIIYF